MFLYLSDVLEALGPPHFVSKTRTQGAAALPNWLSRDQRPDWYATDVSGAGPVGTVAASPARLGEPVARAGVVRLR